MNLRWAYGEARATLWLINKDLFGWGLINLSEQMSKISTILVCVSVVFAAWAFGGTETWAIYVLTGLSVAALVVAGVQGYKGAGVQGHKIVAFLPAFLFFFFVAVQALNPAYTYSAFDQGLTVREHIAWLPSTVSRGATINALLLVLSYFIVYFMTSRVITKRGLNVLIGVVIASAVGMAVLGLLQSSGSEYGDLKGMFLNDNNFSSYINLVLPVVMGVAKTLHRRAKSIQSRSNPAVLLYFCAGILAASVFFTGSRAGAVITMAIISTWVLFELNEVRRSRSKHKHIFLHIILPLFLVAGLLCLSGIGGWYGQLANPVTKLGTVIDTRWVVISDAWQMFLDRIFFGVGAGGFSAAFPYYQNTTLSGFYRNAHNDWIQWLSEFGIIGFSFAAIAIASAFKRVSMSGCHDVRISKSISRGLWIGLLGVSLHAMVDFPFRIPGIAVIVAVWIGMLSRRPSKRFRSLKNSPS